MKTTDHFKKTIKSYLEQRAEEDAHFVCPHDFNAAHDRYVEKKRIERERLAAEEKRKRAAENEAAYREFIQRFLGLSLSDGEILIEPLKSVAEFMEEGDTMHHCVFTNEYFKRRDSLILSAKIGDKRIETIQFDLRSFEVVQSHGVFNKNTAFHKRIIELVNNHKHVIRDLKRVKLEKAV